MPLSTSNTFNLPSQSSSLVNSRDQFNGSLRSLLQNFYGYATPDVDNFVYAGSNMSVADRNGVLYRSSNTGMLYIQDSAIDSTRTRNPVGGSFTRYGIAWRQQGSLAAAAANLTSFDIGEAFVIVNPLGAATANTKLYLRVGGSGTFSSDVIEVGGGQSSFTTDISVTGNVSASVNFNGNSGFWNYNTSTGASAQAQYLLQTSGAVGWSFGQKYSDKSGFIYGGDNSDLIISTNTTEKMRIKALGNVVIGGSSYGPHKFQVYSGWSLLNNQVNTTGSRNYGAILYEDTAYGMELGYSTNARYSTRIMARNDSDIEFGIYTNYSSISAFTPYMLIDKFSNVGIGVSNPLAKLHVAGNIAATGDITAYYSDDRLKTKLGTIKESLSKVKQLTGFYYEANELAQELGFKVKKEVGISAQEVQKVLPEVVVPAPIDNKYLTIHYERLVPLLIEAIKELDDKITKLEEKL